MIKTKDENTFHSGSLLVLTVFILLIFTACTYEKKNSLKYQTGLISGQIEDYDGIGHIGQLIYWDAIKSHEGSNVFSIDSTGSFEVDFQLAHPIFHSAFLDIQGESYMIFLEPAKDLQIKIKDGQIEFLGPDGLANTQLSIIEDSINYYLNTEIEHCDALRHSKIGYKEYVQEYSDLAKKKLEIIKSFEEKYNYEPIVFEVFKKDVHYETAWAWIYFRKRIPVSGQAENDTLLQQLYKDLFSTYPINDRDALSSREYGSYISNIVSIYRQDESRGSLIDFAKEQSIFDKKEIIFVEGYYNGDKNVTVTDEFKHFFTPDIRLKLWNLRHRYILNNVLTACNEQPRGIGRDLIISQAFYSWYICGFYRGPSEKEWNKMDDLISSDFISSFLHELDSTYLIKEDEAGPIKTKAREIPASSNVISGILDAYKGQTIYLDIWATWCRPCRSAFPYSKMLMKEFEDKEVAFLFFCCQSHEEDWKNFMVKEEMPGEHYLLNKDEYALLDSIFDIQGYPTYILIDKNSEVITKRASRPYEGSPISKEINELLNQ